MKLDIYLKKLHLKYKNYLKIDKRSKPNRYNYKLFKRYRAKSSHIGFGNDFLDMALKIQASQKIDKLDFIIIKNFCASKYTIN